jgi:hypothetical protein
MGTEWEYKLVSFRQEDDQWLIEEALNALGRKGWENYLEYGHVLYFKRQVAPPNSNQAVKAQLSLGGKMAGQITVDTTNETATVEFVDDKGDTNAAPPAGAVITFTSDNEAVATVAASAANPLVGDVTPVGEGTANIGATIADASGNPIFEPNPDGTPSTTPFTVTPDQVTVGPGQAVGTVEILSV